MSARDTQLLVSLIEDEYEDSTHRSLAATIDATRQQMRANEPTDNDLFRFLRRQHGTASGRISRVVSKQLFEHASRTDNSIVTIVESAANEFDVQPRELSDDMFCRYLNY